MRAGEAWWIGREELFSSSIDFLIPPQLDDSENTRNAVVRTGRSRDGVLFNAKKLNDAAPIWPHLKLWKGSKMLELASEEATTRAEEAVKRLEKHLSDFRSKVGNDLSSIKAASQRVQKETEVMSEKYLFAANLLTSEQFEKAIANAERMATALKAISDLSETKLSVAVFAGNKAGAKDGTAA